MKRMLLTICIAMVAPLVYSQNIYMKVDGVDGDVLTKGHEKEFSILAFEIETTNTAQNSGGGTTTKPIFGDAKLKKLLLSEANPIFALAAARGTAYPTITFFFTKSSEKGPVTYYKIKLSDAVITSMRILSPECSTGNCATVYEEMHFHYNKIEWTGYKQNPQTGVYETGPTTGWNVLTNASF